MQQRNITKGGRRSTKPTATSKRNSSSSPRGANSTPSSASAARSFRQTAADSSQANAGSKKGNHAKSRRTANPLGDRRTPGAAARNAIFKSPGKQASNRRANKGGATSKSPKSSTAKTARSRR